MADTKVDRSDRLHRESASGSFCRYGQTQKYGEKHANPFLHGLNAFSDIC
jgi:hypothetical protein